MDGRAKAIGHGIQENKGKIFLMSRSWDVPMHHRRDCEMGCFLARMALSDREISTTDCSCSLLVIALLPRYEC